MKILVTTLLSDYKLSTKLIGITNSKRVAEVILVRRQPLEGLPKLRNVNPTGLWARWTLLYELWRFVTIMRLIHTERVNVLIGVQMMLHGLQIAVTGYLTRLPFVLSVIGSDIYIYMQNPLIRPFLIRALKQASAITVKGQRSRELLTDIGIHSNKIFESQDYQDEIRFTPKSAKKRWDLLFVGNIVPVKRVHALIEAVAKVSKSIQGIRLGILGDGQEQARLERLAQTLGISENVEFLGRKPDVENYINASRVVILASQSEGMPAVAIEAIFCGVPVILPDVGDMRGVFNHEENALLVPSGDKKALVDAIVRLLTNDKTYERLHQGALKTRARHILRWNREGQIREWEKILDLILKIP